MADYSAANSVHKTLAANTADKVTLTGGVPQKVEVVNRGTGSIYCTFGGATPTVAGDDTTYVGAGEAVLWDGTSVVRLISASADAYSVHRVDV